MSGMALSAICFIKLCIFFHEDGIVTAASTLGPIAVLVIALSMSATICFVVGFVFLRQGQVPVRFDTKSVCALPHEMDDKRFRVRFAKYATVTVVDKWHPGLGPDFVDMVRRNQIEVQEEIALTKRKPFFSCLSAIPEGTEELHEQESGDVLENIQRDDVENLGEVSNWDDDETKEEVLVLVEKEAATTVRRRTAQHPAPRRSYRKRTKPDRWVPPSGRSTKNVTLGSFVVGGARRSGRIASLMAVP